MIRCDAEYICPHTGGVSACEPRLESVDRERGRAVFAHQCGVGLEDVDIEELDDAARAEAARLWAEDCAPIWIPDAEPGREG